MDIFSEIRRLTIIAMFSDEELMKQLVLKGGNALNLVYGISPRVSQDVDFSMERDFSDLEDTKKRMFHALKDRFDSGGYIVFDEKLERKPNINGLQDERPWWGGYELQFKVITKEKYAKLKHKPRKMQIDALVIGPGDKRIFSADISKCEYVAAKEERTFEHYNIFVYTPTLIVVEKLRAICQQMPEYEIKGGHCPRARDFYDIELVLSKESIDLSSQENLDLLHHVFEAKKVPLAFLGMIKNQREFHRPDWPLVVQGVGKQLHDFDYYFDFVVEQVERLKSLWHI